MELQGGVHSSRGIQQCCPPLTPLPGEDWGTAEPCELFIQPGPPGPLQVFLPPKLTDKW
jgi:hypothetical protein